MERAIRLHAQPPQLVDQGTPQILVDRRGRVRGMNVSARELIETNDGLAVWDGQLRGANAVSTTRLNAAIDIAVSALLDGGHGGAVRLPRPSGEPDLLVTVVPLLIPPSPFDEFRPAALVRIIASEAASVASSVERCTRLFDLTTAEARFTQALNSNEFNLRWAAEQMSISYATARVHLKHLLEKTGTHSQAQLSRLLTRLESLSLISFSYGLSELFQYSS
jgi:DNA-binding CsgD family transcriptional regulator